MAVEQAMLETAPEPIAGVPEWIEHSFTFKKGADPLGFQTVTTDRVIGRLLPGILALSAGLWSAECWLSV
jgi:hypothetical protein